MKTLEELLERCSFKTVGRSMNLDVSLINGELYISPLTTDINHHLDFALPSMKMVEACRADDFDFFQPFISAGKLTAENMHHAAERYYLGKTRSGRPIYWMIDETLDPQDARIVNPDNSDTWMSTLLKAREPFIQYWCPTHCLFGLHQLSTVNYQLSTNISIVESEQAAVVLSELFPESIWMAYATVAHLQVDLFAPLEGRTVTLFPCTDPYMSNYLFFSDLAAAVHKQYPSIHITVDPILEDNATDEQKSRCIDLVEFLFEGQPLQKVQEV
ncbi:MAG: hypothetical protein J6W21_08280 [Bacteroidaceae bacterium]|nr:hypothetical protein [Bacteroidaceae bacterium]